MEQVGRVVGALDGHQAVVVSLVVVPELGSVVVVHEVDVAAGFGVGGSGVVVVADPLNALGVDGRVRPRGQDDGGEVGVPVGEGRVFGGDAVAGPVDGVEVHGGADLGHLGSVGQ